MISPGDWEYACRAAAPPGRPGSSALSRLAAFAPRPGELAASDDPVLAWLRGPFSGFGALESAVNVAFPALRRAVSDRLGLTIPANKARDFARRLGALHKGLTRLCRSADPARALAARLLRAGLSARLSEALARPQRRASRVRDVIDFYYGHASVLVYGGPQRPSLSELVQGARFMPAGADIEVACIEDVSSAGPVRVHLLRVRGARTRVKHLGQESEPLETVVRSSGAQAGTSAGYVLCSDMDLEPPSRRADPVGLFVEDGVVKSPPVFPRACLLDGPDGVDLRIVGMTDVRVEIAGADWSVRALNEAPGAGGAPGALIGPAAFNRAWGPASPGHEGYSIALLGRRVIGAGRGSLPIPKAGMVLALPPGHEPPAAALMEGAEVHYRLPFEAGSATAAGPMLWIEEGRGIDLGAEQFVLAVPPYTFAADETLGQNLLPRMVAGLLPDGALILAAIDGRNFRRAVGMTLEQCRELAAALGCVRAMNLDGGDSKRMVVQGRVVDLPGNQLEWDEGEHRGPDASTLADVRPVYSALLIG